jgi:gliding motility-associated-like protein
MKRFVYFLILIIGSYQLRSQCFEIQSILVDACGGSQEGQNEMVIFRVGGVALNSSNLSVNWPSNSWLGLTQNAGTAADVATVNSTIIGCGLLKEPTANLLPANAKVLLVASESWSPLAQSFVNLNDTLYVIFQSAGNTAGHFGNYQSGGGLRTLSMSFSSPSGCNDAVTYDRSLLVNQAGVPAAQDGSAVEFSLSGIPSYVNNGCQAPFTALRVDAGPDKTICFGATQSFTATASGTYSSINWSLGTGAVGTLSPTNSLVTTYTPGPSETGTVKLYCSVLKACGSQTATARDSVLLTITPAPTVTVNPSAITICSGGSAIVQANSNTPVAYNWNTGANTNTVSLNAAGVYTVNVSNICGNSSATVTVSLSSAPTLSIVSSAVSICASGQTATLSLVGSSGTYSWSTGSNTSTTTISSPGVYSASVSTSSCGNAVANISLGTAPLPVISIQPLSSNSVCAGSTIILTANSNESNYLWPGGVTTNTFSASSSPIVVTTTNACGSSQATQTLNIVVSPTVSVSANTVSICSGQSATVQANAGPAVTYSWSNGANTSITSLSSAGVHTVTVFNACGNASETVTVSLGISPAVTATASQTLVCNSLPATTLTATGSSGTYLWSDGATTATTTVLNSGVYTVTLTNSCGQAFSSVSIIVLAMPEATINPQSSQLCPGYTGTLSATSTAGNFVWSTGATGTSSISVTTAGIYSLTVSNLCGSKTVTASVVNLTMTPLVITPSSYSICPNETATLTASGGALTGLGPVSYAWSNSASNNSVNTTAGGVVTLSVTNFCGVYTQTFAVNVNPLSANITANPIIGYSPLVVSFTNTSTNAGTYLWDFGNGNSAVTLNVSDQVYNVPGVHTVYLTVTNGICTDIDSVKIDVLLETPTLYVPNVFTPNGDSINDVFWIGATNITDFHIIIFDRWGLKLFESSDLLVSWTGTVNGKEVADGCYFYVINAKGVDNTEMKKQGTVTLFK